MSSLDRLSHLRWRCRRGMKELDLLLEAFLAREAGALGQGAWPDLEALLEFEDVQLWAALLHPGALSDAPHSETISAIRAAAQAASAAVAATAAPSPA